MAANGLRTTGWEWVKLENLDLKPGKHTLTMTYPLRRLLLDLTWLLR